MPDIEKLIEKCLFQPESVTNIEDVRRILEYFGYYQGKSAGSHCIFRKSNCRSIIIPTIKGRHVKREYIKYIAKQLELEVWYEQRRKARE